MALCEQLDAAAADDGTNSDDDDETVAHPVTAYAQVPIVHTAEIGPVADTTTVATPSAACCGASRALYAFERTHAGSCGDPQQLQCVPTASCASVYALRASANAQASDGAHRVHAGSHYTLQTCTFVELPADCYAIVEPCADRGGEAATAEQCIRVNTRLVTPGSSGHVTVKIVNTSRSACAIVRPGDTVASLAVVRRTQATLVQLDTAALARRLNTARRHNAAGGGSDSTVCYHEYTFAACAPS